MGGSTIAEVGDRYEGDLLGDHPKAAWEESSQEAVGSVQADGALDRIVDLSSGPTPAREYVSQLFADHLIHAWDLARAIGADERLDPELVDACAGWFASMEDLYRSIGAIGERPEVRPGADPQTTLLAAFGRTALAAGASAGQEGRGRRFSRSSVGSRARGRGSRRGRCPGG
jgi:uncharacterized protein (TIGR03086 family)